MKKLLTTAAILAMLVTAAQAGNSGKTAPAPKGVSSQVWLDRCNSQENAWQAYCWAYTRAVADTAIFWADAAEGPFCIKTSLTSDQLVAVGRKYLKANPKMLEWNAASFLANAFRDTFGTECSKLPGTGV
jgi:Rap1a immunity proteins